MSDEDTELKPDDVGTPASPAPEDSTGEKPVQDTVDETQPTTEELLERARKAEEVAENYKRENEKYRLEEKQKRTRTLEQLAVKAPEEESSIVPGGLAPDTIRVFFEKDKQEVLDSVVADFANGCTEDQWQRFKQVYPGLNTLLSDGLQSGRPISRSRIEAQAKSFIEYAKGGTPSVPSGQSLERARAEGAIDAAKAKMAVIGTASGQKKTSSIGVLDEDREYSNASGGAISPERAKEIRENRERRERGEW